MICEKDVSKILDPVIVATLESHDAKVGVIEGEFFKVCGLEDKDQPADVAFYEMVDAVGGMWSEVAKASFWAGVIGQAGNRYTAICYAAIGFLALKPIAYHTAEKRRSQDDPG